MTFGPSPENLSDGELDKHISSVAQFLVEVEAHFELCCAEQERRENPQLSLPETKNPSLRETEVSGLHQNTTEDIIPQGCTPSEALIIQHFGDYNWGEQ